MTHLPSLHKAALPLAITMGDPCGIGPEIIVKSFAQDAQATQGVFVVGDVGVMRRAASLVRESATCNIVEISQPEEAIGVPPMTCLCCRPCRRCQNCPGGIFTPWRVKPPEIACSGRRVLH